jgi:hypothetical protein
MLPVTVMVRCLCILDNDGIHKSYCAEGDVVGCTVCGSVNFGRDFGVAIAFLLLALHGYLPVDPRDIEQEEAFELGDEGIRAESSLMSRCCRSSALRDDGASVCFGGVTPCVVCDLFG